MDNAEMSSSQKSREPDLVFLNRAGRKFDLQMLPGKALHRGAAFGDFNRDGRVDAVVTRLNEPPLVVWHSTEGGNWIELPLVGRKNNRDGIGAVVHIATNTGEQWNGVTASTDYADSSYRVVHFGLGDATLVGSVEIRWPSGIVHKLSAVPANQILTIQEP